MNDFLRKEYPIQNFRSFEGKNILVVGMGGGCDVFMAYTFAKLINKDCCGTGDVAYANCISERVGGLPSDHKELIPNALYAVPLEPRAIIKGENTYGTTLLEQSVPRGAKNSPLLIFIKGSKNVKTEEDVKALTETNERTFQLVLDSLQVDVVFGIDCGGDSLTGGKDFTFDPQTGRDQQVLLALKNYQQSHFGFQFIHLVLGPGCDAETSESDMIKEVWRTSNFTLTGSKGRTFLGAFSLDRMINECFHLVENLETNRTPYLMYRALVNDQQYCLEKPTSDELSNEANRDLVKLSRHQNSEIVPRKWLTHGLVFKYEMGAPRPHWNVRELVVKGLEGLISFLKDNTQRPHTT